MMVMTATHGVYPEGQPPNPHPGGGGGQDKVPLHAPATQSYGMATEDSPAQPGCICGGSIGTSCSMHPSSWVGLWYSQHWWYLVLQCSGNTEASPPDLPKPVLPISYGVGD